MKHAQNNHVSHMICMMAAAVLFALLTLCSALLPCAAQYKPTRESLESRPLPAWSVSPCISAVFGTTRRICACG